MKKRRLNEESPPLPAGNKPAVQLAQVYMDELENMDENIYNSLVEALNCFKTGVMTSSGLVEIVKVLFNGNTDWIRRFNLFLPEEYVICVTDDDEEEEQDAQKSDPVEEAGEENCNGDLASEKETACSDTGEEAGEENRNGDLTGEKETACSDTGEEVGAEIGHGDLAGEKEKEKTKEEDELRVADYMNLFGDLIGDDRDQDILFLENIMSKFQASNSSETFTGLLDQYINGEIIKQELYNGVANLLADRADLLNEFNEYTNLNPHTAKNSTSEKASKLITEEEDKDVEEDEDKVSKTARKCKNQPVHKSIEDLNLLNTKPYTKSYRRLPDNTYQNHVSKHRTPLGSQVLNDRLVSVSARGKEEYTVEEGKRNPSEEIMSQCEDDMFEADMLLETIKASIRDAEVMLNEPIEPSVRFLRNLERLYADYSGNMMDKFIQNPRSTLRIIIARLRQKEQELAEYKEYYNKIWAKVLWKHNKSK